MLAIILEDAYIYDVLHSFMGKATNKQKNKLFTQSAFLHKLK